MHAASSDAQSAPDAGVTSDTTPDGGTTQESDDGTGVNTPPQPEANAPQRPHVYAFEDDVVESNCPSVAEMAADARRNETASTGPAVDVATEDVADQLSSQDGTTEEHDATEEELIRGLRDHRMHSGDTVIGGYGEFDLSFLRTGFGNPFVGSANVRRLVLFVSHNFTDKFRAYAELEWENALTCRGCVGSVEVEQAFVDWRLLDDTLGLRAGLILVPMGIINQWHEPPVFHGVHRPDVDQLIIPSTWRELGIGAFGEHGMMRYELYAMTAFDPAQFGANGFSAARGQGAFQRANAMAVTGRFELEPWLGTVFGASIYASDAGGNLDPVNALGEPTTVHVPIFGYSLDARIRKWGFEARAIFAQFFSPEADALMRASRDADGVVVPYFQNTTAGPDAVSGPLASRIEGGYIEAAYNVLRFVPTTEQQLLPFLRLEYFDTQAAVPTGFSANGRLNVRILTAGVSYRPIQQVVVKSDIQLRDRQFGLDEFAINVGLGYMF